MPCPFHRSHAIITVESCSSGYASPSLSALTLMGDFFIIALKLHSSFSGQAVHVPIQNCEVDPDRLPNLNNCPRVLRDNPHLISSKTISGPGAFERSCFLFANVINYPFAHVVTPFNLVFLCSLWYYSSTQCYEL